jgi:hypothetical protein
MAIEDALVLAEVLRSEHSIEAALGVCEQAQTSDGLGPAAESCRGAGLDSPTCCPQ